MRPCNGAGECAYFPPVATHPPQGAAAAAVACRPRTSTKILDEPPKAKAAVGFTVGASSADPARRTSLNKGSRCMAATPAGRVLPQGRDMVNLHPALRLGMARQNKWFSEKRQGHGWEGGRLGRSSHRRGFVVMSWVAGEEGCRGDRSGRHPFFHLELIVSSLEQLQ